MSANIWKFRDAKAQFSKLVRRARAGEPQQVVIRGKPAVVVLNPELFDLQSKPLKQLTRPKEATLAGFVERSKKYRGLGLEIPPRVKMDFPDKRREIFRDEEFSDEDSK